MSEPTTHDGRLRFDAARPLRFAAARRPGLDAVRRMTLLASGFPAIALSALLLATASCGGEPPPSDPAVVWAEAEPWVAGEASLLRDDWAFATAAADSLPAALVERVRTAVADVAGGLRVLAIAQAGCIDSAHSIPYLAALSEAVDGLELRAVDPGLGRALMEAHPTPDGRAATPTVLVLDQQGEVRGCWIERPAGLQSWYLANPDSLGRLARFGTKTEWYEADRGAHVLAEFARVLEGAAAGTPVCGLPLDSVPLLPEPGLPESGTPEPGVPGAG